jgi:hypothetical protein
LNRIADPAVPDGCLLTMSAAQLQALDAAGQELVRAMIDGLRSMLEQAFRTAGAGEQEAAELALCTLATNKSLAVLSRAGFSGEELATVAAAAARIPGETGSTASSRVTGAPVPARSVGGAARVL